MSDLKSQSKNIDVEILLDDEINMLLTFAMEKSYRDYLMIFLCLNTGLRNSELVNLTVECIRPFDEITCVLVLPGLIAKGGRSREIPFRPDLRLELKKFLEYKSSFFN